MYLSKIETHGKSVVHEKEKEIAPAEVKQFKDKY